MAAGLSAQQMQVTFKDITVSFSQEEWEYLDDGQKELYREVMKENYETLMFLETNLHLFSPDVLSNIKKEEEPCVWDQQKSGEREVLRSYTDNGAKPVKVKEEKREDHPLLWKFHTRNSDVSHGTERGKTRIEQESEKKHRNPAGDSLDGLTKCERSDREFTNTPECQRHLEIEIPSQNNYSEQITSKFHQREGEGNKSFLCRPCGKSFDERSHFILHQRIHKKGKTFPCSECGKSFTRKQYLAKHEKIHKGERPYACPECGKTFSRKDTVIVHQKFHRGERPFNCSECGQCYVLKKHLTAHQKIHTGEKPFSCTECGRCFSVRRELRRHQKTHTGERAFPCTECHKAFSRKEGLEKHLRVHTGEKPFSCSECGKRFSRKDLIKYHQRRYHQPLTLSKKTSEAD